MLDEKDQRALADIEERLRVADPAFAERMSRPPAPRFPVLSALLLAVFLAGVVVVVVLAYRYRPR
jgi:hypothetical protein